jgi:hypothetical protein
VDSRRRRVEFVEALFQEPHLFGCLLGSNAVAIPEPSHFPAGRRLRALVRPLVSAAGCERRANDKCSERA